MLHDKTSTDGAIGVMDSGIGGLSVLRHIRAELPHVPLLYLADQAHVPYGSRSQEEIGRYLTGITHFFLRRAVKLMVVACNTASAAALDTLRQTFPSLPIVGMEPAVKPAAAQTKSGKIGVLATPGTFRSGRYAALLNRFGQGIDVFEDPCNGLVEQIEAGAFSASETERLLRHIVEPMLEAGVDNLVLGCTHYPFVLPLLRSIVGEAVTIIDPAPAVARQTKNVLQQQPWIAQIDQTAMLVNQEGSLCCYTTGNPTQLERQCQQWLGRPCPTQALVWKGDMLHVTG